MSTLGDILTADEVRLDVDASSAAAVLAALGSLLARRSGAGAHQIADLLAVRERLGSTALGNGFALPHARVAGVNDDVAAFVRTRAPVAFGAPDARPVRCFLALLVPAQAAERHLQLLASAATLLSSRAFRDALRCAESAADVARLFAQPPA